MSFASLSDYAYVTGFTLLMVAVASLPLFILS
jgi:hypothetical protein